MTHIHITVVGLVRNFSFTLPSIVANVFRPVERSYSKSMSFYLTRTKNPLGNPRTKEFEAPEYDVEALLADFPHQLFELEDIRAEHHDLFRAIVAQDHFASDSSVTIANRREWELTIRNYVEFLGLLKLSQRVVKDHPADAYLFLRPDLYYPEPFEMLPYREQSRSTVLTPSWGLRAGTNDRFASVPSAYIPKYFGRLDGLLGWVLANHQFHPKRHLEWVLRDTPHEQVLPFETIRVRTRRLFSETDLKRISRNRPDLRLPSQTSNRRALFRPRKEL
jgi:hypothetical protein